jgi:hypothetical protein
MSKPTESNVKGCLGYLSVISVLLFVGGFVCNLANLGKDTPAGKNAPPETEIGCKVMAVLGLIGIVISAIKAMAKK